MEKKYKFMKGVFRGFIEIFLVDVSWLDYYCFSKIHRILFDLFQRHPSISLLSVNGCFLCTYNNKCFNIFYLIFIIYFGINLCLNRKKNPVQSNK